MKRKTLTIVSIVSIIIISLILLGLTYGYFLTVIEGNESSKSVEIVTGNSKVRFVDLYESTSSNPELPIEPGYKIAKVFTVENTGDVSATYSIYLVDVINYFNRKDDITYNLYKKAGTIDDVTIATDLSETAGWSRVNTTKNTTFPTSMSVIAPNEVIKTPGDIYTYVLKVEYENSEENQNVDQGKTFAFKVNLRSQDSEINPFSEGTLAYNIFDNALSEEIVIYNKTAYIEPSLQDGDNYTIPAHAINKENERILTYTFDDYGTSYYFRGNVEDNYVNFAGMCWRIVRIQGDGSVKLILEDRYTTCNDTVDTDGSGTTDYAYTGNWSDDKTYVSGYDYSTGSYRLNFLNYEGGLADSFKSFQTSLAKKIDSSIGNTPTNEQVNNTLASKLKIDEWCFDDNITEYKHYDSDHNLIPNPVDGGYTDEYYGAYTRIYTNKKPSLSCSGTKLTKFRDNTNMYVATLTADEMSFAGATSSTNYNYYLMNTYAKDKYLSWWSLSPSFFDEVYGNGYAFRLYGDGDLLTNHNVNDIDYSRPAVSLKSGSVITEGVGTLEKPYIIG